MEWADGIDGGLCPVLLRHLTFYEDIQEVKMGGDST